MGSSIMLKVEQQFHSKSFNWVVSSSRSYCAKVTDSNSRLRGQKYAINSNIVEEQWQLLQLRKRYSPYFVQIYDFLNASQSILCSKQNQLQIIIEQIQYRLSDLGLITFEESIYILKTIIQGYKQLLSKQIPFYLLDESNICFNVKGKCKFWINQNLYLGKPNNSRIISQKYFIQVLLEIVQSKIDQMNQKYFQYKSKIHNFNLDNLLHLIYKFQNRELRCIGRLVSEKDQQKKMIKNSSKEKSGLMKVSIKKFMDSNNHKYKPKDVYHTEKISKQHHYNGNYNYLSTNNFEIQAGYKLSLSSKLKQLERSKNMQIKFQKSKFSSPRPTFNNAQRYDLLNPQSQIIQKHVSSDKFELSKNKGKMNSYHQNNKY